MESTGTDGRVWVGFVSHTLNMQAQKVDMARRNHIKPNFKQFCKVSTHKKVRRL
jgi:hypothetical protein